MIAQLQARLTELIINCPESAAALQELKQTMKDQFKWPADSIYMDCDAMDDKPGTKKIPVTDEHGHQVTDEEGRVVMKSLNDDWHVFFREGVADAPAMLFSLTESWCESPYCRVELVWYLVLKTMGAEALLRTEVGGTKVGNSLNVTGVDDLRKDDVVRHVIENMAPEERSAALRGAC